jgi:hypothetical protein
MPITKPKRQNVAAVSTRKATIQRGCSTRTSTKKAAVAMMISPSRIDLDVAAPT